MSNELKYGHIGGGHASFPLPMGASEIVVAKGGRFVVNDDSGRGEVAGATAVDLMGWVEGNETCSATEGATVLNCIFDPSAKYRMPLAYDASSYTVNYASSLLGECCDFAVVNGVQYANPTLSSYDPIVIIGGKAGTSAAWVDGAVEDVCLGDGYVEVIIKPLSTRWTTGSID